MQIWWTVKEFVAENRTLALACGFVLLLLAFAAILVVKTGRSGVYLALSAVSGGGFVLFALAYGIGRIKGMYALASLCVCGGVGYLLAAWGVVLREREWARRAKRAEEGRKLQYGVSDIENTFAKEKINALLKTEKGEDGLPIIERIDLGYARSLLASLREKPLTVAEKIEVENMGKMLGVYLQKPRWGVEDLRTINDVLSALMKLCGKYSVGCGVSQ